MYIVYIYINIHVYLSICYNTPMSAISDLESWAQGWGDYKSVITQGGKLYIMNIFPEK